jgi:type IV pilus assembly protein PilB
MDRKQKKIGEILIEKGLIKNEDLEDALAIQKKTKEFIGQILIKNNKIKESDFLAALSEQFDLPVVSLRDQYIDWNFIKDFSPSLILDYRCFPVKRDDFTVTMAVTNPLDVWVLEKAEQEARGLKLKLVLVLGEDMREVIERYKQFVRGSIPKMFK